MIMSYPGPQGVNCLMPVLTAFILSKNTSNEVIHLPQIMDLVGPGLLQWYVG